MQPELFVKYGHPCGVVSATACRNDTGKFCRCRRLEGHDGAHLCVDCKGPILESIIERKKRRN